MWADCVPDQVKMACKSAVFLLKLRQFHGRVMDGEVRVRKSSSPADFRKFLALPWNIYRNESNWIPPLESDIREKVDRRENPFYEHADREILLAFRGQEPVGRVVAILDHNHNSFHNEKIVFFGLYESLNDPEAARALLEAAAEWGLKQGLTELRGPVNISMNDECAFLLEGFDSSPVVMMPCNPRYYLADLLHRPRPESPHTPRTSSSLEALFGYPVRHQQQGFFWAF
jgi:hypothetical protein